MACARDTSVQLSPEYAEYLNNSLSNNTRDRSSCRRYKSVYPSFTPTINSLSVTSSISGVYSNVMINGSNFLPPCYGTTYVNFGSFKKIPITFYTTSAISFIVPLNAVPGTYNVQVVNIYNSNFSPSVNQSYAGNLNFSNSITYTLS
jgi:hypothetical protein